MYKESCTSWVALSALMVFPPGFRDKHLEKQPTLAKCPKGNFSQGGESEGSFQETSSSGDPFSPHSEMSCPPPGAAVPSMRTAQARVNCLQPFHLFWPHWKPWGPASATLRRLPWWDWHHWKGQASPSCHPELLQAQPRGLMSRLTLGLTLHSWLPHCLWLRRPEQEPWMIGLGGHENWAQKERIWPAD